MRLSDAQLAAIEADEWSEDDVPRSVADLRAERAAHERAVYLAGLARADVVLANAEIELLNREIEAGRAETARLRALARAVSDTWGPWPEGFQAQEFVAALKALQAALAESEG